MSRRIKEEENEKESDQLAKVKKLLPKFKHNFRKIIIHVEEALIF